MQRNIKMKTSKFSLDRLIKYISEENAEKMQRSSGKWNEKIYEEEVNGNIAKES